MKSCIAIIAIAALLAADETADEAPRFQVTTRKADDKVEFQTSDGKVVFTVKSASGIGSATIERTDDKWPDQIIIKLYLKGLENFVVSNGKSKLNTAVSQSDGKMSVRLWKDDKENEPLNPQSPYWTEIRHAAPDGFFEMKLPKALIEGNPKSLSLQWIDFYRG